MTSTHKVVVFIVVVLNKNKRTFQFVCLEVLYSYYKLKYTNTHAIQGHKAKKKQTTPTPPPIIRLTFYTSKDNTRPT